MSFLARFGVERPVPVNILMVGLLGGGIAAGLSMTREFFPEMTPESATVTLPYPGATPQEIEESLARKVEDALADLDEVERLTTTLSEGGGGIVAEFRDGVNVTKAAGEVERAVDALQDLPDDAEELQVAEFEPRLPVIMVSIFGNADEETRKRAIRRMRDDLETLPGMGEIAVAGVRDYEVRVDVSHAALLEHSMSLPDVADAINAWMADVPGGTVRTAAGNINVRTMGVEEQSEAIRRIVVKASPDGQVLRIGDIATVRESYVDEQLRMRFRKGDQGGPAGSLTVYKVGDQDAVEIAEMVRAYVRGRKLADGDETAVFEPRLIDRFNDAVNTQRASAASLALGRFRNWLAGRPASAYRPSLPLRSKRREAYDLGAAAGPLPVATGIESSSDLARFIESRLDLLMRNAKWGALLVFVTLLAFLNWRAAVWVAVGLSTAIGGTILFMYVSGITLNLLTMFGLIIVLGLLVDDAIVVAENILARHDRGEPSLVAAINGTNQVFWPVVATVLTSVVAFVPLTFIRGQIGDLIGTLPWVVACALLMSLIEAVLILPSHLGHSFARRDQQRVRRHLAWVPKFDRWRDDLILNRVVPAYGRMVELLLRYRYACVAASLAVLVATVGLLSGGRIEFNFLPTSDSETIIVDVEMPIGTSMERTEAVVQRIEDAAAHQAETTSISTLVGLQARADETAGLRAANFGSHLGQLFVELTPVEDRTRESRSVIASIREQSMPLEGIDSLKFSEIEAGPGGADITLDVSGEDETAVMVVVDDVKRLVAQMDGVVDVADNHALGQREVQITLKPGAAALGLSVADVARQVRGSLFGLDPHVFSAKREDIDVRVRLDEASRRNLGAIEKMWVVAPGGRRVPLDEVADLAEGQSYSAIHRVNRRRTVTVTADTVADVSPEAIMPALRPAFDELERLHPGIAIDEGGRQRQMAKAFESLPAGFAAALVMIYILLAWLFGSYVQPLAIMLAIPFSLIGVIWGHLLLGYELTFLSLIGFVALSGIVVNDSLILIEFYNAKRADGMGVREGLVAAGRQRLRPILLTTITTVLGLTPLMLERSFQAKVLIPMAISISFGLISATVLILVTLPCIMLILDDVKGIAHYLWHGRRRADRTEPRPGLEG